MSHARRIIGLCERQAAAWDGFFNLARLDQCRKFGVFAAHCVADAALMFTSGSAPNAPIGAYGGEPRSRASLGPAEYRRLLERRGFELVTHRAGDPQCGHHTVWLVWFITGASITAISTPCAVASIAD